MPAFLAPRERPDPFLRFATQVVEIRPLHEDRAVHTLPAEGGLHTRDRGLKLRDGVVLPRILLPRPFLTLAGRPVHVDLSLSGTTKHSRSDQSLRVTEHLAHGEEAVDRVHPRE